LPIQGGHPGDENQNKSSSSAADGSYPSDSAMRDSIAEAVCGRGVRDELLFQTAQKEGRC